MTPEERAAQLWCKPEFEKRVMDVEFCQAIAQAIREAEAEATESANFWKDIIVKDGSLDIEQVKKELEDFSFIMDQVPKVYCHLTRGRLSKLMYQAEAIIDEVESIQQEEIDKAVKEAKAEQREKDARIAESVSGEIKLDRNLVAKTIAAAIRAQDKKAKA